ncbi:MAG: HAMP domain-containing histidine kinase [candidate division Zixibacteria bacterium]|nr:HAMP domain-containing histidine kinase [candidate division Zixibacteria bacterium]
MLVTLSVAHFLTPHDVLWVHDFLFKVTYLPIVLAALWFGLRGGLYLGLTTCAIYVIHIQTQLAGHHQHAQTSLFLELVLYLLIGGVVGWLSDQQRAARDRLTSANAQLQRSLESLREKTEALLAAEESLRQADRQRAAGQIALGLAHEVRNPLGGIVGAAEILANPDTDATGRAEFAAVLAREVKRLDRVITDLLDFARPTATAAGVSNLRQELDFVEKLTTGPRGKKNVAFDNSRVPADLVAAIPPDAFRQVALNLTLNALSAVPSNSGRIEWCAAGDGRMIALVITDNGPGVDPSVVDRLFEPFVSTTPEGTGLGLAIVARLVGDTGGKIHLDNSGTPGTKFVVQLPSAVEDYTGQGLKP